MQLNLPLCYAVAMTDEELRLRHVIAEQIKEIDRLRAEVERLQSIVAQSADAMSVLQLVYTDPEIRPDIRVAAAKAALPHQLPKLSLHTRLNLAQRLDSAPAKVIEHTKPAA